MVVPPIVLGIVNITEDSFSDGGRYLDSEAAIKHAVALSDGGADMVDLGPAASNPDSVPVTAAEEIRRLGPVMDALSARGIVMSVDSFQPETQRFAMYRGAAYLNDIEGFSNPEFYREFADASCKLIVMHSVQRRGVASRVTTDPATILDRVIAFFDERIAALETAGVGRDRIIVDPGMGFFLGANPEASVAVLRQTAALKQHTGLPILISVSRKSFVRNLAGVDVAHSGSATLAAELFAVAQGADYIRTHDVAALLAALRVTASLN